MSKLSDVQAGRIGEYLCSVYAMLTTDGALVPFSVAADDDHRDLVVAVKGRSAFASLQAKACFQLGASGFVQSNATYSASSTLAPTRTARMPSRRFEPKLETLGQDS